MKAIVDFQKEFDKKHGWYREGLSLEEKVKELEYLVIALAGELREIADPLKKFLREIKRSGLKEENFKVLREKLKEELTDVFIYTIIVSILLDIDLEKEFYKKHEKNKEKYKELEIRK